MAFDTMMSDVSEHDEMEQPSNRNDDNTAYKTAWTMDVIVVISYCVYSIECCG